MGAVERSRRRPAGPPSDRLRLGAQDARGALARDDSRLAGDLRLAWGMRDWVATPKVLAGLRELRPGAPVTELLELGHYPQIEQLRTIAALAEQLASSVM